MVDVTRSDTEILIRITDRTDVIKHLFDNSSDYIAKLRGFERGAPENERAAFFATGVIEALIGMANHDFLAGRIESSKEQAEIEITGSLTPEKPVVSAPAPIEDTPTPSGEDVPLDPQHDANLFS